jgi:Zn-dependent protease with chaperone function
MRERFSLKYSFDLLFALAAVIAVVAVLQTFVLGRHYIIPTGILAFAVLCGNLAWWGFKDQLWAKYTLFWIGFLFTCHAFFALFFSVRYRELLGDAFEVVCGITVAVSAFLVIQYARRNRLFGS